MAPAVRLMDSPSLENSRSKMTCSMALMNHPLPSSSLAIKTTRSGSNPNFFWSSLSGADAPNVFMPMMRPRADVSLPSEGRGLLDRDARRHVGRQHAVAIFPGLASKMSQDGIETTRDRMPSAISFSWASTARISSLPEAMRMTSGFPPGASAST